MDHTRRVGPAITDAKSSAANTVENAAHKVADFIQHPIAKTKQFFAKADDYKALKHQVHEVEDILDAANSTVMITGNEPTDSLREGLDNLGNYRLRVKSFEDRLKSHGATAPVEILDALRNEWTDELHSMYTTGLDEVIMAVQRMKAYKIIE